MNFFAAGEDHSISSAVAHKHSIDWRPRSDLRTAGLRRPGDRFADSAHPAANESPEASNAGRAAHHVVEHYVSSARSRRTAVGADDSVGRKRSFYLFGFEALIEIGSHALSHDLYKMNDVGILKAQRVESELAQLNQVAKLTMNDVGRSGHQQSLDPFAKPRELMLVLRISLRVAL